EQLGAPVRVVWFPASRSPVALVSPSVGRRIAPGARIELTFSRPLDEGIGPAQPRFSPDVRGRWRIADSHTLVFTPAGFGFPFASTVRLRVPGRTRVSTVGSP